MYQQMSTARMLWLIWCLLWAGTWFFMAFFTFGLSLILTVGSVAAFWIPVGKAPILPPCVYCHYPFAAHYNGQCPGPRSVPTYQTETTNAHSA